jgi:hypothetical protein
VQFLGTELALTVHDSGLNMETWPDDIASKQMAWLPGGVPLAP